MEVTMQWLQAVGQGIPSFFLNPFLYLLLLIFFLQWRRQVEWERKLFSVKLHHISEEIIQSILYGGIAGLFVSISFVGLGVVFSFDAFMYLWIIALLLMIFHVRYLCFAYAGALLAFMVVIVRAFPAISEVEAMGTVVERLDDIHLPSIFALVAILHLAEALLVYLLGTKKGMPIFVQSKRGRLVGGYQLQHMWLIPMLVVAGGPTQTIPNMFQGWPLISAVQEGTFSLLLLPAVLAFSDQAISSTPEQKARSSAQGLLLFCLILLTLTLTSEFLYSWLIYTAIPFSFLGREALVWYSRWKEYRRTPLYVHPLEGLKILAIIPHSPADKMGLKAGEVILKVNGQGVNERKDLYAALQKNMAFCKLDVLNEEGQIKFAKSSVYQEDHHQLGIVLVPDETIPYYMKHRELNLWRLFHPRLKKTRYEYHQQNTLDS